MFCEKYVDRGILYLYDELEPNAKHDFEAHLKTCPQCQCELALLKESKLFAQVLPLEEIEPISYEEIVPLSKPVHSIHEKYIQPFLDSIRSLFQNNRRLVLVPVGVAFLLLIMFYLFNPGFKSSVSPYSEKITKLKSEYLFMERDSLDNTFYSSVEYFSDQHIDQIEADIQSLSSELNHFNF